MDIKGDWKKRAVCGLMVLAMALSLLPTSILAADTRSVTENAIKNGSFEEPAFHDKNSPQWPANNVPDWDTTASDQLIEFGSTRRNGSVPHINGRPNVPDGFQFAELNADEESTLYQYAATVGGNVYEWGLSHRGRYGIDRMALIIGPKQDIAPAKPSKNGKDQFMRMTDWVRQHASDMGVTAGCTQKITVYSKKFAENGGFQNDTGDAFNASPTDVYTEKWNVWIIGTSNNAWGNYGTNSPEYAAGRLAYSCRYAVPDGQTETVFAFCSYSAATSDKTLGNLIDNIHFSLYQTITAAATAAALWLLHRTFPCPLTALLAPANGSPWEMGKLLFWPYLPAALVIWRLGPEGSVTKRALDANAEIMDAIDDVLTWYQARGLFKQYENELGKLCVDNVLYDASVRILKAQSTHPLLPQLLDFTAARFPDYRHNPYLKGYPARKKLVLSLLGKKQYRAVHMLFAAAGH